VRSWANRLPDWVSVHQIKAMLRDDPKWRSLDAGEQAAIALAVHVQPSILLIEITG